MYVRRYDANLRNQNTKWDRKRRVVATVKWHPGELFSPVGLDLLRDPSATKLSRPAESSTLFERRLNIMLSQHAPFSDVRGAESLAHKSPEGGAIRPNIYNSGKLPFAIQ